MSFNLFLKENTSSSSLTDAAVDNKDDTAKARQSFITRILTRKDRSPSPSLGPSPQSTSQNSINNRSRESSLPPLYRLNLNGYKSSTKHRLLDDELANNIRNLLPPRLQLFDDWDLVYSFEQNGISLNTLYNNSNLESQLQNHRKKKEEKGFGDSVVKSMVTSSSTSYGREIRRPQGYVMIIRDEKKNKFGCYINENLKPVESKRYYGNGECFLWKVESNNVINLNHGTSKDSNNEEKSSSSSSKKEQDTRFKAYMYTGINDNIIFSNHNFIAIGSSNGQNGLWIDKSLYKGVSYPCETFGNEILNIKNPDSSIKLGHFEIMDLEIWRIGSLE